MVTGKVEEGETATEAAWREVGEETGLTISQLYSADAVETFFLHAQNRIICSPVFVGFVKETKIKLCPDEHDAYEWLSFEEALKRLVWTEQRRVLTHIHEHFILAKPCELLLIPYS